MELSPRRIRHTVNRARNHWYRLGVPRDVRHRLATDLHAELVDAAARGLPIEFVVGDDLATFAAGRAPRDGRRDVMQFLGELALGLVVAPALIALAFAALYDRPVGFHVHELIWVLGVVLGSTAYQAARDRRGLDDGRDWSRLGLAGLAVFTFLGFTSSLALQEPPRFVAVPATLAWGVLAAAAIGQLVVSGRRRALARGRRRLSLTRPARRGRRGMPGRRPRPRSGDSRYRTRGLPRR